MPVSLPHIAARIFGRPLLIDPRKAEMLLAVLGERIGIDATDVAHIDSIFRRLRNDSPAANRLVGTPGGPYDQFGHRQLLYNVHNGVALIPIVGTLVNRGAFVGDDGSGAVSYEGLATQIAAAGQDRDVHSILLDIDSPGGEANGMAALADTIRSVRGEKPIVAHVNDIAASAAYGIAAQADETVISPASAVGSIGVVLLHMDYSAELAKKGRKPTFIYAGAHKVDGNFFEPLSDGVRADLQSEVDQYYGAFVRTVAAGRGKLTEPAIR